jgi:hypothetical protein
MPCRPSGGQYTRVTMASGPHLYPFRTQKLSLARRWYCYKRESRLLPGHEGPVRHMLHGPLAFSGGLVLDRVLPDVGPCGAQPCALPSARSGCASLSRVALRFAREQPSRPARAEVVPSCSAPGEGRTSERERAGRPRGARCLGWIGVIRATPGARRARFIPRPSSPRWRAHGRTSAWPALRAGSCAGALLGWPSRSRVAAKPVAVAHLRRWPISAGGPSPPVAHLRRWPRLRRWPISAGGPSPPVTRGPARRTGAHSVARSCRLRERR